MSGFKDALDHHVTTYDSDTSSTSDTSAELYSVRQQLDNWLAFLHANRTSNASGGATMAKEAYMTLLHALQHLTSRAPPLDQGWSTVDSANFLALVCALKPVVVRSSYKHKTTMPKQRLLKIIADIVQYALRLSLCRPPSLFSENELVLQEYVSLCLLRGRHWWCVVELVMRGRSCCAE